MPKESPRKPRPAPGLEREKVVSAALELLNEQGFDGLKLRGLAAKLGVKAPALYWHFENKQDLIDQLAYRILDEEFATANPSDVASVTWQQLLRAMGKGMRSALSRYRDGALIIAKADMSNVKSFKGRDQMVGALLEQGFSGKLALSSLFMVGRFTLGCVFEEQADPRSRGEESETFQQRKQQLKDTSPAMARALEDYTTDQAMSSDFQFEQGLEIIIAGIDASLKASK